MSNIPLISICYDYKLAESSKSKSKIRFFKKFYLLMKLLIIIINNLNQHYLLFFEMLLEPYFLSICLSIFLL